MKFSGLPSVAFQFVLSQMRWALGTLHFMIVVPAKPHNYVNTRHQSWFAASIPDGVIPRLENGIFGLFCLETVYLLVLPRKRYIWLVLPRKRYIWLVLPRTGWVQENGLRAVLLLIHHQCSIHCESSRVTHGTSKRKWTQENTCDVQKRVSQNRTEHVLNV